MQLALWFWTFITGSRLKGLLLEGERLLAAKQYPEAETIFLQVREEWPDSPQGYDGLARAYRAQGMQEEAQEEAAMEAALGKATADPNDVQARMQLAKGFSELGFNDLALAHADQARRLAPQDPAVVRLCAQVYRANQQYAKALEVTKQALRQDPLDVELYDQLAAINRARGDAVAAAKMKGLADALRKVAKEPGNLDYLQNAVFQLTVNGSRALALPLVDRSMVALPQSMQLQTLRAELQLENADLPGALKTLQRALELDATNERTHQLLLRAYLESDQGEKAEHHRLLSLAIEEANRLTDPVEREVALLQVLVDSGQAAKAKARAEALRQAHPQDWRGPFGLSLVHLGQGQHDQALAMLVEAARLDPNEPKIPLARANLLARKGLPMEAVGQARKAVNLAPRDPEVRLALAALLRTVGQAKQAQEELEIAEVLRKRGSGRAA